MMRLSRSCQRLGKTVLVLHQRRCCCPVATSSSLRRMVLCSANNAPTRNTSTLALHSELEETSAQSSRYEQQFEATDNNMSSNTEASASIQQANVNQKSASRKTQRLSPSLVARVSEDYKTIRERMALRRAIQRVRGRMIAFVLRDDYQGALALSARIASDAEKANDPELFSATLLMMARGVRAATADKKSLDESEAVSLLDAVIDLCRMLTELAVVDRNSTAAMLALLDAVHNLKVQRGNEAILAEQEQQLEAITRLMLVHRPLVGGAPRTFMNVDERSAVDRSLSRLSDTLHAWPNDSTLNLRYEKTVPLLEDLHENVPVAEYLGSPHQYPGLDQDNILALMKEQLDSEMKHCLRVKNIWRRDPTGKSAEEIIDEYDWPTSFAREIVLEQQNMTDPFLSSFISAIPVDELVHAVMSTAYYMCQTGLGTVPITVLRRKASDHVMGMVRSALHRKFGFDKDQVLEKMLAEYSRIFTDDDLPRRYTHREWWMTCAAEMGVDPTLQCPLMSLDFHNLLCERVGRFVVDVMLRGAKFPIKHQQFPAFYECNIDFVRVGVYSELSKADKKELKNDPSQRSGTMMVRMVGLDQRLSVKLKNKFDYVDFNANELPMIAPPRPWLDNLVSGGFISHKMQGLRYGIQNERLVDYEEEVHRRCRTPSQLRPVVDAVNILGATAWRINEPVLDVNIEVFKMGADPANFDLLLKLAIPMTPDTVQLPEVPSMLSYGHFEPLSIEEKFEFVNAKHELYRKKKERKETASIWHTHLSRITIANEFRKRTIFSPCYLDFRGRAYPMSPYFSHLSFDSTRSCFLFAKGKPLGENGLDWLKIHCINLTGLKKRAPNAERLAYANEVLDLILDSADRPMDGKRWWMDADKPWGALAACMEIRDAIRSGDPPTFVSHLPVHQDGSCNGLQHYAALGRDLIGATEVNLTPADRPQDLYASVAERVEEKRVVDEADVENDVVRSKARELRQLMPGPIARKTVKQTVMTTVYGVTNYGAMLQVKRQLKLLGMNDKQARIFSGYISKHTLNSLDEAFVSSMQLKRWLRDTAGMITGRNCLRTIEWMTPLALPVIQPYVAPSHSGGSSFLKPMVMKQINSFPPNYIHSLDSTHLFLTALHLHHVGGTIGSVHDCYWTHASDVPLMNKICRQQFVNLHQIPLVELIGAQMSKAYLTDALRKDIGQDLYDQLEAQLLPMHKFGNLDLEAVNDSVYFFS